MAPEPRPEAVKLHFAYTVQHGDLDLDGVDVGELLSAIDLGGARIQSAADLVDADGHKVDGVDADLAHQALGSLSDPVDGGTAQPPAGSGITIIDTHGNPLTDNRLTIRESTRGRYGLKLNTRPTHRVDLVGGPSDGDEDLRILPTYTPLPISPDEWETPLWVDIGAALDDDEENGERVFLNRVHSQDPAYNDLILPDVIVVEDDSHDDAGALSVADANATEGVDETLDFVVKLNRRPSLGLGWKVTVDYRTQDGTATAGFDYTSTSGTLTFAPGEDKKTVSVLIMDDAVEDNGETFTLVLSNASGAGFASFGQGAVGTIRNTETLTATFPESVYASAQHTGPSDRPQVVVAFSAPVAAFGADTPSVSATGALVDSVQRLDKEGLEHAYVFFLTPEGHKAIAFRLHANRACTDDGICTADRQQLSNSPSVTVAGPETGPPPLTAAFEGLPEAHDGEDAFRVRVAFSEEIGIGFRSMRDDAFTVDGGEVTGARRVDGRHDLWEITVEPDSNEAMTITLLAGRACAVSGAICTRGENRRQLTNTPTATVAGPPVVPLTANFVQKPYEHDGETAFTLRIAFSEGIAIGYRRFRDQAVSATGGRVTKAKRVDRRKDLWEVTVEPDTNEAVTLTLAGGRTCGTAGAVCTGDGRALSAGISTTVLGPPGLSVADARVDEAADAVLDFAVSLSRATSGTVAVAYATADGSATAGSDYTATAGTLTFAPGETAKTVSVPVLDDAHDEGEETLTLRLTTATGAVIADGEATGTIKNTDTLQRAWLARFGRTAATHVTDAVGERLRAGSGASHVTVGGYRLPLGQRGAMDGADDGVSGVERLVLALGQRLGLGTGTAPAGAGGVAGAGGWPDAPVATDPRLGQSRTLDVGNAVNLRQVLLGSSFRLSLGAAATGSAGPRLTAWGRVAGTTFDGREGDLSLNGDVLTGTVGVDGEWDRLLAGLAVAHSRGDGSFTKPGTADRGRGDLETTLTSIHPYLRYAVNDRLDMWGVLGYGTGHMEMEVDTGETRETDMALVMGAFGGRGILLPAGETGGFELATRTDAMLTRTSSDAVAGMASADAEAHRLRLVLEGSRGFAWPEGRRLTPTMEVGLRHDWGDAETGFGLELGGRVHYADPALGLTIDAAVRGLLAHEDDDYQEWGASGSLRLAPGAGGQGLALTLAPTWGAASSGVNGLWSRQTPAGLAPEGTRQTPAGQLNAEIGYGVAAPFGTGLLTPYAGTVLSEGAARTYRVGGRLQMRGGWATGLTLNLEGTRQDPAGQQPVNQGLRLQLTWGF